MENKKFLETAKLKIEEEIKKNGFIVDSDNTDRFLDNICLKYAYEIVKDDEDEKDIVSKLLEEIKDQIMCNYKRFIHLNYSGYCEVYYYNTNKKFTSLKEFYKHFDLEDADQERL